MLVFTYGTLKTGQPNHGRMQNQKPGQCIFIGRGVTLDKYPLVVATDYHAPFLLYKPGIGHNIEGEIYEVGDECLDFLDKLEHHPEFYTRLHTEEPGQCVFKGRGVTMEKYPLVVALNYNVPFLLYKPGTGHNVEGEIYEVGDDCLSVLDRIEHHPDFYTRQQLQVRFYPKSEKEEQGQIIMCNAYFLVDFRESLLENPMYKCYTDNVDGKMFVAPAERRATSLPMHEVHKGYDPDS